MNLLLLLSFGFLQLWTNYPILLVKAKKWNGHHHEAYIEHKRRSKKSVQLTILFIVLLGIRSLILWLQFKEAKAIF